MNIIDTKIADVKIIEPRVFGDERGFFMETWNQQKFEELVCPRQFVQDNHSKSLKGILRGLHYQLYFLLKIKDNYGCLKDSHMVFM